MMSASQRPVRQSPVLTRVALTLLAAATAFSPLATSLARADSPSTTPATKKSLPTPAELIEMMKKRQKETDALPKVALIELSGTILERPAPVSLFGQSEGSSLLQVLTRLKQARDDKDIRAVVLVLSTDLGVNLAQATEIRDLLSTFRKAGKKVFVYADAYDTLSYTLASGASDIVLMEGGELFMPGIGLENQFYKGLMDKVGVKGDYVQIGEYKGAEEPYTRIAPSEELKGEMNKLADGLYTQITTGIAKARMLPLATIQQAVDDAMIPAQAAKDRKLVDHLADRDSIRPLVEDALGGGKPTKLNVVPSYGLEEKPEMDFSNPFSFLAALGKKSEPITKDTIAVVYADGTIVDGSGGGAGLFGGGGGVGGDDIRQAMRAVREDDHVKAIVIRIDSPGGSALASEVMWQAVRKAAAEKPVIISIGSMAASGGYYLASSGDEIIAEPSAIVGSIGVVGGKFVLKGLFDKLGISSESYLKGRNADIYSQTNEWTERQRKMIQSNMRATYEQFTDRVMTTRRGKITDIDQVARGRVFVAADALKLGMVDELGGLSDAIHTAADRSELKDGEYDVRTFPETNPLKGILGSLMASGGAGGQNVPVAAAGPVTELSVLNLLAPDARKALVEQIRFVQLLQKRPVLLHIPFSVTVK